MKQLQKMRIKKKNKWTWISKIKNQKLQDNFFLYGGFAACDTTGVTRWTHAESNPSIIEQIDKQTKKTCKIVYNKQ